MGSLLSWIGITDLKAMAGDTAAGNGPLRSVAEAIGFREIHILCDAGTKAGPAQAKQYCKWLKQHVTAKVTVHPTQVSNPTDYLQVYRASRSLLAEIRKSHGKEPAKLVVNVSSGTNTMAAVWVLLAKTEFPAEIYQSHPGGVELVQIPFDLTVDVLPALLEQSDSQLIELASGSVSTPPEFEQIVHATASMRLIVDQAKWAAIRDVPVLLLGETGTGKELFADAIHRASPRRDKPIIKVNCGAMPAGTLDSYLFGHRKGAFTDAKENREGVFESANGGTVFLDEIGDLPLDVQARLLRTLQEGEIVRVGESRPRKTDVRIIAATHRDLVRHAAQKTFREDLFYRLAVAVLQLPPLRERKADIVPLAECFLDRTNQRFSAAEPGYQNKTISPEAKKVLHAHQWPGNARELENTIVRAAVWSRTTTLTASDIGQAILGPAAADPDQILYRPMGQGFSLDDLVDDVRRHYIRRAMAEAGGQKKRAAWLLGLKHYQTLSNQIDRLEIDVRQSAGEAGTESA